MRATILLSAAAITFAAAPASAQDATAAQPLNLEDVQREVVRALPATQRFYGMPDLRFGFMVDTDGRIRTCMALPVNGEDGARGQDLCATLIETARFAPARNADGQAVEGVFIASFDGVRGINASQFAGVPII